MPHILEANISRLWARLNDRLAVRSNGAQQPGLSPTLVVTVPIKDVDALPGGRENTAENTGSEFVAMTVPDNFWWELYSVYIVRQSGDRDVTDIQFRDVSQSVTVRVDGRAAYNELNPRFEQPYPLDEGDEIRVLWERVAQRTVITSLVCG